MKRSRITTVALVIALMALSVIVWAQSTAGTQQSPLLQVPQGQGGSITYSPAQLGVNALVEPAAGTTALSSTINLAGAREISLFFNCTTGNVTVNVQTFAEDGTTALAKVSPVSAVPAAAWSTLQMGSEANPTANVGTVSGTALLRLPLPAAAFSFTNAGAAGTCTARLFVQY